jgi:polar amino acid transport system substrate-binding protein
MIKLQSVSGSIAGNKMCKTIHLLAIVFSTLMTCTTSAATPIDSLHLASNERLVEQVIAAKLLLVIYERSNLAATITPLPPARANLSTLKGMSDGEVARIEAYASKNPSLLKVSPAYYYLSTVAFSKAPINIRSKDDLKKYKIGAIRGVAHSDAITEGLSNIEYANDARSLFLMLQAGRFDIAIDTGANGQYLIKELNLEEVHAVGELARLELFHILAPSKKHLAARLSETITTLKRSGELETLIKRYEREFLQSGVAP